MGTYQDILDKTMRDLTDSLKFRRVALERAFKRKGITLTEGQMEKFLEALVAYEAGTPIPSEQFPELEGVDLGSPEFLEPLEEYGNEIVDRQTSLLQEILATEPARVVKGIRKRSRAALSDTKATFKSFGKNLDKVWGKGFKALELMLGCIREYATQFLNEWDREELTQPSDEQMKDLTLVLRDLHMKSCRIAAEILCLLRGGYADGAHARWRSLHELAVIASFIATHKGDLPRRYRDHAYWDVARGAKEYQDHCAALGHEPHEPAVMAKFESDKLAMNHKYGNSFNQEYGWAASVLPSGQSGLAAIERHAGLDHWRPYYKMACHAIHGGAQGLNFALGNSKTGSQAPLTGASDLGLLDPAQCTAISLGLVTAALFTHRPNLDSLVATEVVRLLGEDVTEQFASAHDALEGRNLPRTSGR